MTDFVSHNAPNENALRTLKATESVTAAFHAAGFPSPPAGLAAILADHVRGETQSIPIKQLANMSPGTGPLNTAASAGVSLFVAAMTPDQRAAMKAGVNPLDASAVARLAALLHGGTTALALLQDRGAGSASHGRRATSEAYAREIGGNAYGALLKEGFRASELNAIMPYARELGWTDRNSLRILAGTGPTGAEVAKEFEDARKRGDAAGMAAARKKAEEHEKSATTDKARKGWKGMIKKFDTLNKNSNTAEASSSAAERNRRLTADSTDANAKRSILDQLRKQRMSTKP